MARRGGWFSSVGWGDFLGRHIDYHVMHFLVDVVTHARKKAAWSNYRGQYRLLKRRPLRFEYHLFAGAIRC